MEPRGTRAIGAARCRLGPRVAGAGLRPRGLPLCPPPAAGTAVPGSHLIACRFVAGTGRVCRLQFGLRDASYLSIPLVHRQSRVGHDGHLLPGAVFSVFAVQAYVELDSKETIKKKKKKRSSLQSFPCWESSSGDADV